MGFHPNTAGTPLLQLSAGGARGESLTEMQLDVFDFQGVRLAMPRQLAGSCHHALYEIVGDLQQHLQQNKDNNPCQQH